MSTLGFDNYVEPLKLYLQKYRESMKGEKQPGDGFEEIDEVICKCYSYKNRGHVLNTYFYSFQLPLHYKIYRRPMEAGTKSC